jgi:hypothetical protein
MSGKVDMQQLMVEHVKGKCSQCFSLDATKEAAI